MITVEDFQDPPFEGLHANCSPNLSEFDYSYAVMTFGGYPTISWEDAEREILRVVRTRSPFETISAASIWHLERSLDRELARKGLDTYEKVRTQLNAELRRY